MDSNRTIWRWLADWLAVRRPTRLIVDGIFLMFCGGVVYLVWTMWWQLNEEALRTAATRLDRTISLLLSTLHSGLFNLGVVIIAAGCARLIAEGASSPATAEPTTRQNPVDRGDEN